MDSVLSFFASNLIWFILGTVIFLLALIGYFTEGKNSSNIKEVVVEKPSQETLDIEKLKENVADKPLNQAFKNNNIEVTDTKSEVLDMEKPKTNDSKEINKEINTGEDKNSYDQPLIKEDTTSTGFKA